MRGEARDGCAVEPQILEAWGVGLMRGGAWD